ncbi:MAG: thrombospondin type 3 repeat-containing protein [Kiritimatiellia bacterium]
MALLLLGLLAGCATLGPVQSQRPLEYVFPVHADRGWQNSGISVRRGEIIHCMAEGQWGDDFGLCGPRGQPRTRRGNFGVEAPANGLLMRLSGQTNRVYFVGEQANIVAERPGHVFFRGNATVAPNPRGALQVTLMVARDSDGEGLSDYEELQIWGTDPLRADSDGTGFTDEEIIADRRRLVGEGILRPSRPR